MRTAVRENPPEAHVYAVSGVPPMRQDDAIRVDEPSTVFRRAVGDLVRVAARLGRQAGDGEILITEATYRMVRGATEVEKLDLPIEL